MTAVLVSALAVLGQATEDRQEALYRAIAELDEKAVRRAVEGGASLRLRAKGHDAPPLFYALNWPEMFDLLRRLGAPVDGVDLYGRTLLHYMVGNKITLLTNVPNPPRSIVSDGPIDWFSSWEWRKKTAADLILLGLNVEARDVLGRTALHYAVQSGWRGVDLLLSLNPRSPGQFLRAEDLLRKRVDANARDADGATPLIVLAKEAWGRTETAVIAAGLLLEVEAVVSLRDRSGKSAEDWAVARGRPVLAALLKAKREEGPSP